MFKLYHYPTMNNDNPDETDSQSLPVHPAANLFPLITGHDFDELVADIRANGQREPIVVHDEMILVGRNRYRACIAAGIAPTTVPWDERGTPEAFVISKNLRRRHLKESERAMVAAKLAKLKMDDNQHTGKEGAQICAASQEAAAKMLNVSRRTVQHAAKVIEKGTPKLVQAVESGAMAVSKAAKLTKLPEARQQEIATSPAKAKKAARRLDRERAAARQRAHTDDLACNEQPVQFDPDFRVEADAAARDIEIERDERIAMSGGGELADENEKLRRQIGFLDRRIASLLNELGSAQYRAKFFKGKAEEWEARARELGWKDAAHG